MTVLVCGAGGLLGGAVTARYAERGEAWRGVGRVDLEGTDDEAVARLIDATEPTLVVNCAADVDAERAEDDDRAAVAANIDLPRRLARACAARGLPLVHFSSTGCYGDWQGAPYEESDPLRPTTRHHHTKAAGEQAVRESGSDHLIVRTGWLYGGHPGQRRNFVWNRLVEARGTTRIIADSHQRGCPTWVDDVAEQLVVALAAGLRGTINLVAHGAATRADYVTRIVAAAGLPCTVEAGPAFSRRAPVSANETARNARLLAAGLDVMRPWQEGVDAYVATLLRSDAWAAGEDRR